MRWPRATILKFSNWWHKDNLFWSRYCRSHLQISTRPLFHVYLVCISCNIFPMLENFSKSIESWAKPWFGVNLQCVCIKFCFSVWKKVSEQYEMFSKGFKFLSDVPILKQTELSLGDDRKTKRQRVDFCTNWKISP